MTRVRLLRPASRRKTPDVLEDARRTFAPFPLVLVVLVFALAGPARGADADRIERGAYLARAGGCFACHTDFKSNGTELAGGRPLASPFGTFYSPNITPDPETGIGRFSDAQFLAALKRGIRPDGSHYFPAFPYTSYSRMTDEDALAIKAYLFSRQPARKDVKTHDLPWLFGRRSLQGLWKALYFEPGEFTPDPERSASYNRGAYIVRALAHCGECHTPRDSFGGPWDLFLAGTSSGPEGRSVPNITPEPETGIGRWSQRDLIALFRTGRKPNFDNVQGAMQEVVEHGLKYLDETDLAAIAEFVLGQAPIYNRIERGPSP
jgi:mono/diheme cytochrome c family protein